ncbi:hypothetical protein AX777_18290 [Sphingobium yanoikuyae]|uniref:Uncharacterized protein n=1 Tax=Sphingobium yanoikuyae TaxID=13690 RepID=A0A177J6Y3_SPHYA|nr:hypothetical protein AX777_18290 [Sphingobium yanoikuyae]
MIAGLHLSGLTRLYGICNVGEIPQEYLPSAARDVCLPATHALMEAYADVATGVGDRQLSISQIFGVINETKIGNPIVRTIAVNVIDLISRPFSVVYRPRNSVRGHRELQKFSYTIALVVHLLQSLLARIAAVPAINAPHQIARSVCKEAVKMLRPALTPIKFPYLRFIPEQLAQEVG